MYRYIHIKSKIESHLMQPNRYVNLDVLVYFQVQYNDFMAILVFLAWIKVVKYMQFNKTLRQFSTTLERVKSWIFHFYNFHFKSSDATIFILVCQRSVGFRFHVSDRFHCICTTWIYSIWHWEWELLHLWGLYTDATASGTWWFWLSGNREG